MALEIKVDTTMEEWDKLAASKVFLHLPPNWEKDGTVIAYLGWRKDGKVYTSGVETDLTNERINSLVKEAELVIKKRMDMGATDITLMIEWRSHKWYSEYNDHYRKSFELEYTV